MSDIFENVANKYRNTPSALVLFVVSFALLVIGINHFAEDTYSSYAGLISIESYFDLNVQVFEWTYWTMSVAPQIAGIVFFYIYLANTNKAWALYISVGTQTIDFLSDLWYRSNGSAFTDWNATLVSAAITLGYFTLGSEAFVTFGSGLCLKLAAPALHSWKYYRHEVQRIKAQFENSTPKRRVEYMEPQEDEESGASRRGDHFIGKSVEQGQSSENFRKILRNSGKTKKLHGIKNNRFRL